jgi:hypothetical protein
MTDTSTKYFPANFAARAADEVSKLNALVDTVAGLSGGGAALDTNAADIQAVGTVAAAGATGLGADAGHVHVGASVPSGIVRVIKTAIAFNTANLDTGVVVYTPAVGDILLSAWTLCRLSYHRTARTTELAPAQQSAQQQSTFK